MQDLVALLKVIVVGDPGVGKSAFLQRITLGRFEENFLSSTVGVDYKIVSLSHDTNTFQLQIWDTAGQERYGEIVARFFKGSHAAIFMFDLTNRSSFRHLESWMNKVESSSPCALRIVVANKSDLVEQRTVSQKSIRKFCDRHALKYAETSLTEDKNVMQVLDQLISGLLEHRTSSDSENNSARLLVSENNNNNSESSSASSTSRWSIATFNPFLCLSAYLFPANRKSRAWCCSIFSSFPTILYKKII